MKQDKKKIQYTKNKTICICASTRFVKEILFYKELFDSLEINCLIPNLTIPKEKVTDNQQIALIYEHFEKIKRSDIVFILNPGGYIGTSVTVEIGFAKALNKKIVFLEKSKKIELDCLISP